MKSLLLFFASIFLFSYTGSRKCSNRIRNNTSVHTPEIFIDFEKVLANLDNYSKDTLDTIAFPGEGGEVIVYHSKSENILMQVFIYGEMGKVNYRYLLDKQLNHKLTQIIQYRYDKPFSETDMQMDSTINYICYVPEIKLFDSNKLPINDTATLAQLKTTSESLFKEIISQTDLHK